MIEVRKTGESYLETNKDYVLLLNNKRLYFTEKALFELRDKLDKLCVSIEKDRSPFCKCKILVEDRTPLELKIACYNCGKKIEQVQEL